MSYDTEFGTDMRPTKEEAAKLDAAGLVDSSWHNDICCSWAFYSDLDKGVEAVRLWVDATKPEDRECGGERFEVLTDDGGESLYSGDDLDEAIKTATDHWAKIKSAPVDR